MDDKVGDILIIIKKFVFSVHILKMYFLFTNNCLNYYFLHPPELHMCTVVGHIYLRITDDAITYYAIAAGFKPFHCQ